MIPQNGTTSAARIAARVEYAQFPEPRYRFVGGPHFAVLDALERRCRTDGGNNSPRRPHPAHRSDLSIRLCALRSHAHVPSRLTGRRRQPWWVVFATSETPSPQL